MPSPSPMDILKMKVTAFKDVLEAKKPAEKKGDITWAFAEDFNKLIAEAKKADPAMAEHLPDPIKFPEALGRRRVQKVDYLHIEIMLNRIIGTIKLFEKN